MAKTVHHVIVSYDVSEPKRLAKVAKIMKDYGERVLKSVFECNLTDSQFQHMKDRVDSEIAHMEDSVRFCFVCGKCVGNVEVSGLGTSFFEDEEISIT